MEKGLSRKLLTKFFGAPLSQKNSFGETVWKRGRLIASGGGEPFACNVEADDAVTGSYVSVGMSHTVRELVWSVSVVIGQIRVWNGKVVNDRKTTSAATGQDVL